MNPNISTGPVVRAETKPPVKSSGQSAQGDSVSLQDSEAVNKGVQQTPNVRAESVARARELVGDANYPSPEVVGGVSNLLAAKLDDNQD